MGTVTEAVLPRKLNYGCGFDQRPGYLNVDMDPGCAPDLLIVDNDLSGIPKGWFDEVLALDVLEHIPRLSTQGMVLEWADMLVDGGRLIVKTSSITGVASQLHRTTHSFREQFGWTQCLFGTQGHSGDFHYTGFTETTLRVHLLAAGFEVTHMWITDHWLLHAEGTKTSSWTEPLTTLAHLSDEDFAVAAYREWLGRDPEPGAIPAVLQRFEEGSWTRRDFLYHVRSSVERLYVTAARHGLDEPERASVTARVASRTPEQLKPALRQMNSAARTASVRTRRAIGGLRARSLRS